MVYQRSPSGYGDRLEYRVGTIHLTLICSSLRAQVRILLASIGMSSDFTFFSPRFFFLTMGSFQNRGWGVVSYSTGLYKFDDSIGLMYIR
ncbi:hypothetical protein PM082_023967 [Marasmius tenuissimus]|nr:hypothetical protein PM082_023967 [Marasmius tenuissimus]